MKKKSELNQKEKVENEVKQEVENKTEIKENKPIENQKVASKRFFENEEDEDLDNDDYYIED